MRSCSDTTERLAAAPVPTSSDRCLGSHHGRPLYGTRIGGVVAFKSGLNYNKWLGWLLTCTWHHHPHSRRLAPNPPVPGNRSGCVKSDLIPAREPYIYPGCRNISPRRGSATTTKDFQQNRVSSVVTSRWAMFERFSYGELCSVCFPYVARRQRKIKSGSSCGSGNKPGHLSPIIRPLVVMMLAARTFVDNSAQRLTQRSVWYLVFGCLFAFSLYHVRRPSISAISFVVPL